MELQVRLNVVLLNSVIFYRPFPLCVSALNSVIRRNRAFRYRTPWGRPSWKYRLNGGLRAMSEPQAWLAPNG